MKIHSKYKPLEQAYFYEAEDGLVASLFPVRAFFAPPEGEDEASGSNGRLADDDEDVEATACGVEPEEEGLTETFEASGFGAATFVDAEVEAEGFFLTIPFSKVFWSFLPKDGCFADGFGRTEELKLGGIDDDVDDEGVRGDEPEPDDFR